jgi:formylglycine-generating enzyme required for sulfatase activity
MSEPGEDPGASVRREGGRRNRGRPLQLDKLLEGLQPEAAGGPKTLQNSVGMPLVLIPAGTFLMGSPDSEVGRRTNEGPVHEVVIGSAFYMSTHLVTQADYRTVTVRNPSRFTAEKQGGPDHPVEMTSWEDAVAFCRLLSERADERMSGRSYRLPTEAEWEYACRAGTTTPFGHGSDFGYGQGNCDTAYPYGDGVVGPPLGATSAVTRFPAGAWGLFDAHGNVWEWCSDWYSENYYRTSPLRDPAGPPTGKLKVLRGGSWRNQAASCRAAYRNALAPHQKDSATGFRVVMVMSSGDFAGR